MRTAIFKDPLFLEHQPGAQHVESPDRLLAIYSALSEPDVQGLFSYPQFVPAFREIIGLNHSAAHIARIEATANRAFDFLDADTQTSAKSYEAACLAVGAVVQGVRMLLTGETDNAFALVRPPGHHAEPERAMGFCLFNNIAVGAHYALREHGLRRVLVVDWDLHHGNGTQRSFYETDAVLYFSTHQYPLYPGTGALLEAGAGQGEGYTVNIPLPGGMDDSVYATVFKDILTPIARQYRPELILVSAGFDIALADPLGAMRVSTEGFALLTRMLMDLADELCNGRILFTLEGGYDLPSLKNGVLAVLRTLVSSNAKDREAISPPLPAAYAPLFRQFKSVLGAYWQL